MLPQCSKLQRLRPHPYELLIDVLCQVLAPQHSSASAGSMPHDAANDHANNIQLSSKPAAAKQSTIHSKVQA
jgi:hypothetical protein